MNWFNSTRVVSIVSLSVVALFLITGFVLAGERTTNYGNEGIDARLRALVEAGKITQGQADMKRKAIGKGKGGKKSIGNFSY